MDPEPPAPARHHARVALRVGRRVRMSAEIGITSAGIVSVAALVSSILLSTAVIVGAARRPPR